MELSNDCALQWLTYDKQALYGRVLHCSSFSLILSKELQTELLFDIVQSFRNRYNTQVSVRGRKCVLLLLSLTAFRCIIGGATLWSVTTASSLSLSMARSDHISQTNWALELRHARARLKMQSVSTPLENNRTT